MSPSNDSVTRHPPSLHRIAPGRLLRLLRYYGDAPRPCRLSHRASSPPGSTTPRASGFAPTGKETLSPTGQELLFLRCPRPDSPRWRRQGVPGSWETPMPACPALRPRWNLSARPFTRRLGTAFRISAIPSASTTAPISGLNHAAYELAVYASQCWSPNTTQDSLPAGGQPLPGGSQYPLGLTRRFPRCLPLLTSLPPSPGLTWRTAPRERARNAGSGGRSRPHPAESLAGAPEGADPAQARATDYRSALLRRRDATAAGTTIQKRTESATRAPAPAGPLVARRRASEAAPNAAVPSIARSVPVLTASTGFTRVAATNTLDALPEGRSMAAPRAATSKSTTAANQRMSAIARVRVLRPTAPDASAAARPRKIAVRARDAAKRKP